MLPLIVPSSAADLPRHLRACAEKRKSEALLIAVGQPSAVNHSLNVSFLCLDHITSKKQSEKEIEDFFLRDML